VSSVVSVCNSLSAGRVSAGSEAPDRAPAGSRAGAGHVSLPTPTALSILPCGAGRAGGARCLPPHGPGLRIGLFGGSFNPPHAGHRQASLVALRRLGLDAVWWIVTPGNPLKDNRALPPMEARIAEARRIADHPRIHVTGLEAWAGGRYTVDLLRNLVRLAPEARLVWIMGSDNLLQFHRWRGWRRIAATLPIAVIDRPGSTHRAVRAPAAAALGRWRLDESDARLLPTQPAPAWVFLHGPRSHLSSTALRAGKGPAGAG
jgi:nicotinate-nucleotide adenylyltransferase